jgi:hypothetical protein
MGLPIKLDRRIKGEKDGHCDRPFYILGLA